MYCVFRPINKSVCVFRVLRRHIRTQRVCLIPRGSAHEERRRVRQSVDAESSINDPPKPESVTRERSIDDIDPVVLKYTKLINDLRVNTEKYYPTNFGSIRYDSENIPVVHGQFDQTKYADQEALFLEELSNKGIKFDDNSATFLSGEEEMPIFDNNVDLNENKDAHINLSKSLGEAEQLGSGTNYVDDLYFGSTDKVCTRLTEEESKISEESALRSAEKNFDNYDMQMTDRMFFGIRTGDSEKPNVRENYVDSAYFGNTDKESPQHSTQEESNILEEKRTSTLQTSKTEFDHDMNIIDEMFFGASGMNLAIPNNPEESPQLKFDGSNQQNLSENIPLNSDLNYIDNNFFKESFNRLSEKEEPSPKFLEIKRDIESKLLDDNIGDSRFYKEQSGNSESRNEYETPFQAHVKQEDSLALEHILTKNSLGPTDTKHQKSSSRSKHNVKSAEEIEEETPKNAFDFVQEMRNETERKKKVDNEDGEEKKKKFKIVLDLLSDKKKDKFTKYEILKLLKMSIIYDKYDIIGLYKPYGLAMHEGTRGSHHLLSDFLPDLARHLRVDSLYPIHRLDANTTGVLLLARTPAMADKLKAMFKERQLKKVYWAITKGIPNPLQGIIDIPIAEGTIDGRRRMVLRPDVDGLRGSQSRSQLAVTKFKVMSHCNSSSLVELNPMTGVKHQLRVHMGFGMNCPILGDHKYSHLKKMAPQRLPGDMLTHLNLKQSRVRDLPIFLHSRSVILPEIVEGRNINITARLPAFFNKALSFLELNKRKNQVRYDGLRCVDEAP